MAAARPLIGLSGLADAGLGWEGVKTQMAARHRKWRRAHWS
jgi:hypothetical protein